MRGQTPDSNVGGAGSTVGHSTRPNTLHALHLVSVPAEMVVGLNSTPYSALSLPGPTPHAHTPEPVSVNVRPPSPITNTLLDAPWSTSFPIGTRFGTPGDLSNLHISPVVSSRTSYDCSPTRPSTDSLLVSPPHTSQSDGSMKELMRSTPNPEPPIGLNQAPNEIDPFMRSAVPPTWNQTGDRRQTQLRLLLEELDVRLRGASPLARLSLSDLSLPSDEGQPNLGTPRMSYTPGYKYSNPTGVTRDLASPPLVLNLHEGIAQSEEWVSPISDGDGHDQPGTLGLPLGKLCPSPATDSDLAARGTAAVPLHPSAQANATIASDGSSSAFKSAWLARLKQVTQRRLARPNNPPH